MKFIRMLLAAAAMAVVGGSATPDAVSAAQADPALLAWTPCEGGECATLRVPLDYGEPDGEQIAVALFRIAAAQPEQRIGSLLVNPGGPGASGVEHARTAGPEYPEELRNRFDIVGFDPRGTTGTLPIDCGEDLDPVSVLGSPKSPADRKAIFDASREYAWACAERNPGVLAHVGSRDTVRDMDRIRAALGEEQLTYLGISYGTRLGALYADLFPGRVRALVLDAPLSPSTDPIRNARVQARGFERSLDSFFESCAGDATCPFHNDGSPQAAFDELVETVRTAPIPTTDGRELGLGAFEVGVTALAYLGESGHQPLATALAATAAGDGGPMLGVADVYLEREPDGTYSDLGEALNSIVCVDNARPPKPSRYRALEPAFQKAAPRFGLNFLYFEAVCSHWTVRPADGPPIRADEGFPILLVAATGDPATPYRDARELARRARRPVVLDGRERGTRVVRLERLRHRRGRALPRRPRGSRARRSLRVTSPRRPG